MTKVRLTFCWLLALLLSSGVHARAGELSGKLPGDTLAFLELNPTPLTREKAGGPTILDVGLEASRAWLPRDVAAMIDILNLASAGGRHHSVLAWLDADLRASPAGGLECRSVQLAWISDTKGQGQEMRDLLAALLRNYATQKTMKQTVRTAPDTKRTYVEFRDDAWPEWLKVCWTQDGESFVITLGAGAMEHYLAGRPEGPPPWEATLQRADTQARTAGIAGEMAGRLYFATRSFRDKFPDAVKQTVLARVSKGLDADDVDAAVLTARASGRLIGVDLATLQAGKLTTLPWTLPAAEKTQLWRIVPQDATGYVVFRADWPVVYSRAVSLLAIVLEQPNEAALQAVINRFARSVGVSIHRDILEKLSPIVVMHDSPPHPLRAPGFFTAVAAAKPGSTPKVSGALDRLLDAGAKSADHKARIGEPGYQPGAEYRYLRLRRDKDNLRYLQFGIVGPAWQWADRFLIYSWGPPAVRLLAPKDTAAWSQAFESAEK